MIFENGDTIVFAGDSVTDMGSVIPVAFQEGDAMGRSYVRVIDSLLGSIYPEICLKIINSGMSGDTSRMLLARYDRDVVAFKPDWVSICIGINDVWRQFDTPSITEYQVFPEEYEKNVEEMILRSKPTAKGIFIVSPYFMEPLKEDPMRARMDIYVEICRKLAEKHGCIFVDFQDLYARYCTVRHSAYINWDRIHPNQVGATLMAREFLSHCDFDYNHKAF